MSEYTKTRLRKRKLGESCDNEKVGKLQNCSKKSKAEEIIHVDLLNDSANIEPRKIPSDEKQEKDENMANNNMNKEHEDIANNKEHGEKDVCNADFEDTKEYETNKEEKEAISEHNISDEIEGEKRTSFEGIFRNRRGKCELLSKLLNDANDSTQTKEHEIGAERSGHASDTVNNGHEVDEEHHERKQLPTSCNQTGETKVAIGTIDETKLELQKGNNNKEYQNNAPAENLDPKLEKDGKSLKSCPVHWPLDEDRDSDSSSRISTVTRDNPRLTELIVRDDTAATAEENNNTKNGDKLISFQNTNSGKQLQNRSADVSVISCEDTSIREKLETNNNNNKSSPQATSKQRRGRRKRDDVDNVNTACEHENETRKMSARLRRRSGESWAVRYEKDYVVTPLSKLTKEETAFPIYKGLDATIVSEERLCRELRQRCERLPTVEEYEDAEEEVPVASSSATAGKNTWDRKKKYKRKFETKLHTAKRQYVHGKQLHAESGAVSPVTQADEAVGLPVEAVLFPATSASRENHTAALETTELRRSTRSTPLLFENFDSCKRPSRNDEDLLSDSHLSRHACALWSSENRRHFQLTNPECSGEMLDNLMRTSWERLGSKEKVKYVQRARNALKDRNRHSCLPSTSATRNRENAAKHLHQNTESHFRALPPAQQQIILDTKLNNFKKILSPGEYSRFLQDFKIVLRSKLGNMQYYGDADRLQGIRYMESLTRSMLYNKVKDYEPRVEERRKQVFYQLRREYDKRFQSLVMDILNDESVWRTDLFLLADDNDDDHTDKTCDELGWIIEELGNICCDEKTIWSEKDRLNIDNLAEELKKDAEKFTECARIGDKQKTIPEICELLLKEACSSKHLPELTADDVERIISGPNIPVTVLPKVISFVRPQAPPPHSTFHDYVLNTSVFEHCSTDDGVSETCCELESPSCVLTAALLSDRLENRVPRPVL